MSTHFVVTERAEELFRAHAQEIAKRTDRLLGRLFIYQWLAGILIAFSISPGRWAEISGETRTHVWIAVLLGGVIAAFPLWLTRNRSGEVLTRHVVAAAQMLFSALLIHLTGRTESHYHIFGSLALLAFYRDWRVLVTASVVITMDHLVRGFVWPESVYGVLTASPWRSIEHGAWVMFENAFLAHSCMQGQQEMRRIAAQRAELEGKNQDLEEQKHLAEQFAAQLQRSNRELQDFASIASHDLQEPLRKVQAFGDRLNRTSRQALGDQGRDYLDRMLNAASRMQDLIQDLLAFSRVTTTGSFARVPLDEVASRVMSDLEVRVAEKGASVRIGGLPVIDADPRQMHQLLQNLIGNALKFHRPGERPQITVEAAGGAATCELRVADNGIGFDEKYLDRIFTVFQRLHGRSEYEGTGIGLAICRRIAEHHGGTITARSTLGRGSVFIVTLPVQQDTTEDACSPRELPSPYSWPTTTPTIAS